MIREFQSQDINPVMNIWFQANIDAHPFIHVDYWKSNFEEVKHMISDAEVYISEVNNNVNGFIGLIDEYIAGIFVNKTDRASGIGSELLHTVKMKHAKLSLSVYEKNKNAVRFYEKAGFHIIEKGIDKDTNQIEYTMIWER